jgi:hypothetical protein
MFKLGLTALVTAAVCFAVAAATGLGASSAQVLALKKGDVITLKAGNFGCRVLTASEVACGANTLKNAVTVYYGPHQLAVIKFDKTGKKYTQLYAVKR